MKAKENEHIYDKHPRAPLPERRKQLTRDFQFSFAVISCFGFHSACFHPKILPIEGQFSSSVAFHCHRVMSTLLEEKKRKRNFAWKMKLITLMFLNYLVHPSLLLEHIFLIKRVIIPFAYSSKIRRLHAQNNLIIELHKKPE